MTILEEGETFLDCVVREIHEELGYYVPPERFHSSAVGRGADRAVPGGIFHGAFFVTPEVPLNKVNVTEATLNVAEMGELGKLEHALTPSALFCTGIVLRAFTEISRLNFAGHAASVCQRGWLS